jgi:transcription-repair coupling factor (superfamily II helicase)
MQDFYHRRFNVLVCTTIIESGIDIPSANTIIINRADRFGLAQLYQLRGRVGRSHHRAYAYLLIPHRKALSPDALKRMDAIESLEELGVGFTLAVHDLEIRGAGEILGADQSGHIQEVGFSLYAEMLDRAINDLKRGVRTDLERSPSGSSEVDLHIPALFPEDYLPDVHSRLILYKRIASAKDAAELQELREEIVDRFGPLPESAQNLIRTADFRLQASALGVRKLDLGGQGGRIFFQAQPNIDTQVLIRLVHTEPRTYRLERDQSVRILKPMPEASDRIQMLDAFFTALQPKSNQRPANAAVH